MDKRTNNLSDILKILEHNHGIIESKRKIRIVTDSDKFPNEILYLPEYILLRNKTILKLRELPAVLQLNDDIDLFGLRVLVKPFQSENELTREEELTDIGNMKLQLKEVFPFSAFLQ